MAKIKLTLPLTFGGIAAKRWAHCILDVEDYVEELNRCIRMMKINEVEELLWRRACEYIWHAYYCADPLDVSAWERFELEQELRFVWKECVERLRWEQPLDEVPMNEIRRELFTIVKHILEKRKKQYARQARKFGVDPLHFAIDKMQEQLAQGKQKARWGLVDYETLAFFPIEGQSLVMEWLQEIPGFEPSQVIEFSSYLPEAREQNVTYRGEQARECFRDAIENVSKYGKLFVQWFVKEKYRNEEQLWGNPDEALKIIANYIIRAGRLFVEELINEKGTGLLQIAFPKYRDRKLVPWRGLLGGTVESIIEHINDAAVGSVNKLLSVETLLTYIQKGWYYKTKNDDSEDENNGSNNIPEEWKACFYAIFPTFSKNLEM